MKSTLPGVPAEINTVQDFEKAQRVLYKEISRACAMVESVKYHLDELCALCGDLADTPFGNKTVKIKLPLWRAQLKNTAARLTLWPTQLPNSQYK